VLAEVHQSRQAAVFFTRQFLDEYVAHVRCSLVMRNHAAYEVNGRIAGEIQSHSPVHLHIGRIPKLNGARAFRAATNHMRHTRHHSALVASLRTHRVDVKLEAEYTRFRPASVLGSYVGAIA
jgi:hypothetical protein